MAVNRLATLLCITFCLNALALTGLKPASHKPSNNLSIEHEKYQLKNGLTVILAQDKSTPFVAANLWYQVGAVNEKPNKTGLAHLFEHLMFEGTSHAKAGDHFKLLEKAGAFSLNASTSFDKTNYYQTVPKNSLELALALEASRMYFLKLDQAKLDEQRAVVRREREQRYETTPYGTASLALWQSIFPKNNPLHGRVIGSHADLQAASLSDVQAFYDKFYGPSNACLTLVGDFDKDTAKTLIDKYFATLPASPIEPAPTIPKVVIDDKNIIKIEEKLGRLPLVRMQYITPALFAKGDAELDILSYILSGGENGRLTKALTRDTKIANSAVAYQQSMEQISVFSIDIVLNQGVDENIAIKKVDEVLASLISNPPSASELERARNSVLTGFFFGLQDLGNRAELLQSYNRFAHDSNFIEKDLARYQAVTKDDLVKTAKTSIPSGRDRKILVAMPYFQTIAKKDK